MRALRVLLLFSVLLWVLVGCSSELDIKGKTVKVHAPSGQLVGTYTGEVKVYHSIIYDTCVIGSKEDDNAAICAGDCIIVIE